MKVSHKVTAYINCQRKLLVFAHVDFPEAGIQVPGGSVDQDEDINEAVLREAREETSLEELQITEYLGKKDYVFQSLVDEPIMERRHFFHLSYPGPIDDRRWRYWEESPSEGKEKKILFELYWVDQKEELPELSGNLGEMLNRIS